MIADASRAGLRPGDDSVFYGCRPDGRIGPSRQVAGQTFERLARRRSNHERRAGQIFVQDRKIERRGIRNANVQRLQRWHDADDGARPESDFRLATARRASAWSGRSFVQESHRLTDRRPLVSPERSGEARVDDHLRSIVAWTERSSRNVRDAECRKVSGIHFVELHLNRAGHVSGPGLVEACSNKWRDADESHVETGRRVERKRQPPNEVRAIRRRRVASRDIHRDRVKIGQRKTRIDPERMLDTSCEQSGDHEQDQRDSHLPGDERVPQT